MDFTLRWRVPAQLIFLAKRMGESNLGRGVGEIGASVSRKEKEALYFATAAKLVLQSPHLF
ncbi:MAG: hypothetical protein J6Y80_01215 [Victivallales bacterium]|nr:hypothetical protein [Victivallales bacterium]